MTGKTKAEIKERFDQYEYPVHLIGRHVSITDPIKKYALDKLAKIERFGGNVLEALIILDVQKSMHTADFVLYLNNQKIKVSGRSEDMYASIDQAIERLASKIRRYMERLHDHHAKGISEIEMNVNVLGPITPLDDINDQIEEENLREIEKELMPHKIVSTKKRPLKTLNRDEAIMKMELSEDQFLIYRCEEDQKLKVIYRRDDGNYGIIEPER